MEFFDKFIDSAQKVSKKVCDKAVDVKGLISLEYKATTLRNKIDKEYRALGSLVYNNRENENEIALQKSEIFTQIFNLNSELCTINSQISKLKNACPYCNATNTQGAVYCSKCGKGLK